MRCFTIFSSVRECSSLSASMKFQIVGLVQLTILLKPLCRPSAMARQVGGSRKSADGGIPLVPSKLVEEGIRGRCPKPRVLQSPRGGGWRCH